MVAIVSGNHLGVNLGSLGVLGRTEGGAAGQGSSGERVYVNVATGNLVVQDADEQLMGRGGAYQSLRTYNSQGHWVDRGLNWSIHGAQRMVRMNGQWGQAGSSMVRLERDGAQASYLWDAQRQAYVSTDGGGAYRSFTRDGEHYVWHDGAGTQERYSADGRLESHRDAQGRTTAYRYDNRGRLKNVLLPTGEQTHYIYDGENLAQVQVETADGQRSTRTRYRYDAQQRLSEVIVDLSPEDNDIADGRVYATRYTYDGDSERLASISQADGSRLRFTYVQDGDHYRIATVTDALGHTTRYTYQAGRTIVTDALGQQTRYHYDAQGQLTEVVSGSEQAQSTVRYAYNERGDVISITDGAGRITRMRYDARGNQIAQEDAQGNLITRRYDDHNRMIAESLSRSGENIPPRTTHYVYGSSDQLRFTVSAEGRVTEYRYNAQGDQSTHLRYTQEGAAGRFSAAHTPLDEATLVAWANTQPAHATERRDMDYDARGQLARQTTYATLDSTGQGQAEGAMVQRYVYDQWGRLLQTINGHGGVTLYGYDSLGREIARDEQGQVTVTRYEAAGKTSTTTHANGLTTQRSYDAAGRLLTVSHSSPGQTLGTIRYHYDAAGRLVMREDATGARSYLFYDTQGRLQGELDATGALTEYRYNGAGQKTRSLAYATRIDLTQLPATVWPELATLRPARSTSDRLSRHTFDATGRLAKDINAHGAVTAYQYDAAGNLIRSTQLATLIDIAGLGEMVDDSAIQVAATAADRSTRHFYEDGLLTASLDAEGYLSHWRYDGAGRQIAHTRYAQAVPESLRAEAELAALQAAVQGGTKSIERSLYNARGQVAGQIDAQGYLTETLYDANGNIARRIRYATAVGEGADLADLRPAPDAQDRSTSYRYDNSNRLIEETDYQGTLTRYRYDAMGNVVATTRAAGAPEAASLLARHDLQGHKIAELSARGAALLQPDMTVEQIERLWQAHGTHYRYDALGRQTARTDANGHQTSYVYDAAGRLTHTINALGEVNETSYDVFGQATATTRYARRLDNLPQQAGFTLTALQTALAALGDTGHSTHTYRYDSLGLLLASQDAAGLQRSYAYNSFGEAIREDHLDGQRRISHTTERDRRGHITRSTRDAGGLHLVTQRQVDAWGRITHTTDAAGNTTRYEYDRLGRQIVLTDAMGGTIHTRYDAFERIVSQNDRGSITRYRYDHASRSSTVTLPDGAHVVTTFDRHGQQQSITDARGNVTRLTYDANGNLIAREQDGQMQTQRYDNANRLLETIDETGRRTVLGYDAANRVITRTVDPDGLNLTTHTAYDAQGRQVSVTQPGGQVTQFTYDAAGRLIAQTVDPDGLNLTTRHDYDATGNVIRSTQPNGNVTALTYDNAGRRMEETIDPEGLKLTRRYSYDPAGNLTQSIDANGHVTRYVYDANNRKVWTINPLGAAQQTRYDGATTRVTARIDYARAIDLSRLSAIPSLAELNTLAQTDTADASHWTTYDAAGRIHQQIDATGAVTRFTYDANGNVTTKIKHATLLTAQQRQALADGQGIEIHSTPGDLIERSLYDSRNRLRYQMDALGHVTEQRYDAAGNPTDKIAYARPVTAIDDESNWADRITPSPEDRHTRTVYDAAGRLRYDINAQGHVSERRYDANGNVQQQISYANAIHASVLQGALNEQHFAEALRPDAADRSQRTVYDAANRAQYQIDGLGYVTENGYDNAGNLIKTVRYAQAASVMPDAQGRLQLQSLSTSAQDRTEHRHYDAVGRLRLKIDALGYVTENRYDNLGKIVGIVNYREALAQRIERHDPIAVTQALITNRSSSNGSDQLTRYTYNAAGQLTQSTDALGNSETYTYNALGQRTSFTNKLGGTTYYTYDKLGRQLSETLPVSATGSNGQAQAIVNRVEYDAFGNRITTIEAVGLAEERTTRYTFDANGRPLNRIGQSTRIYVHGQGWKTVTPTETTRYDSFGNLIAKTDANGYTTRYYYDAANRVIGEVGSTGAYIAREYDAAGNVTVERRYATLIHLPADDTLPMPQGSYRELRLSYDANGQLLSTLQAQVGYAELDRHTGNFLYQTGDIVTRTAYNAMGQAVMNQDAQGRRSYLYYDALGRKTLSIDAAGYAIAWQYDANGNILRQYAYAQALDRANPWSESSDAQDLIQRITASAQDRITDYEYDALNRQTAEIRRNVGNSSVDANGRLTEQTGDAMTRNAYNSNGDLTARTDAIGNTIQREYDLHGRHIATLLPTATDHTGRAVRQTTRYQYNGLNLITQETVDGATEAARVTRHTYDASGRRVSQTLANGEVIHYGYDAQGNTTAEIIDRRQANGSVLHEMTSISYDGANREVRRSSGSADANNNPTHGNESATSLGYDAFGKQIGKTTASGNSQGQAQEFVEYDAAGRIWRSNADRGITKVYFYDRAGRPTLTLQSQALDLRAMTAEQIQQEMGQPNSRIATTITVYDERGQVIRTIQPKMSSSRPHATLVAAQGWGYFQGVQLTSGATLVAGANAAYMQSAPAVADSVGVTGNMTTQIWRGDINQGVINTPMYFLGPYSYSLPFDDNEALDSVVGITPDLTALYGTHRVVIAVTTSFRGVLPQSLIDAATVEKHFQPGSAFYVAPSYLYGQVDAIVKIYVVPANGSRIQVGELRNLMRKYVLYGSRHSDQHSVPLTTSNLLRLSNQTIKEAARVDLYYRPQGSSGPYSQLSTSTLSGQSGTYVANMAGLHGHYDMLMIATDSNGRVIRSDRLNVNRGNNTVSRASGVPNTPIFEGGTMHMAGLQLGNGKLATSLTYKLNNGNTVRLNARDGIPGLFAIPVGAAAANLELNLTATDGSTDTLVGSINPTTGITNLQFIKYADSTLVFNNLDRSATRLEIKYREEGKTDWKTKTLTRTAGNSSWTWDTQSDGLVPDRNKSYRYEVTFDAFDTDGIKVNNGTAVVAAGAITGGTYTTASIAGAAKPRWMTFNAGNPNAASLAMRYRIKGSKEAYTEITLNRLSSGVFKLDISALPTDEYEYVWDALDAAGKTLVSSKGYFRSEGPTPTVPQSSVDPYFFVTEDDGEDREEYDISDYIDAEGGLDIPEGYSDDSKRIMLEAFQRYKEGRSPYFYWSEPINRRYNVTDYIDINGNLIIPRDVDDNFKQALQEAFARYKRSAVIDQGGTSNLHWVINLDNGIQSETQINRSQRYDAFGNIVSETDGNGNTVEFEYNALGQLTIKRDPATDITLENGYVATGHRAETRYYYDAAGNLTGTRDASGNLTTQRWHFGAERAQVAQSWAADGGIKKNAYDVFGNLRTITNEDNWQSTYQYDALNRLVTSERSISTNTKVIDRYEYDIKGQRIAATNALGHRSSTRYDSLGRVVETTSAEGRAVHYAYTYDAAIASIANQNTGGWRRVTTDANGRTMIDDLDTTGRALRHVDLSGRSYTYRYNHAGLIDSQRSTAGQHIDYSYYGNGYVKNITDRGTGKVSTYEYDNNGNRIFEGYMADNGQFAFQQQRVTYDAMNRVVRISDPRYDILYEYDALSNRRRMSSTYTDGVGGHLAHQEYWYKYDSQSRFTISMGQLMGGKRATRANDTSISIERGQTGDGVALSYTQAGLRASASYAATNQRGAYSERYYYDGRGLLTQTSLDDGSRVIRDMDAAGRVTTIKTYNPNGSLLQHSQRTWNKDNQLIQDHDVLGNKGTRYELMADGTVAATQTYSANSKDTTLRTMYTYDWWDSAKQTNITLQARNSQVDSWKKVWRPGFSHFSYDVNGHSKLAYDEEGKRAFSYWTDADGQVLKRQELIGGIYDPSSGQMNGANKSREHSYYYLDGKRIGDVGNDQTERTDYAQELAALRNKDNSRSYERFTPTNAADFDANFQPINSDYPAGAPSSYTVRQGDTLQSIARGLWGDASLWYMLAEANGLINQQPSAQLAANSTLIVPNQVTNIHNTSSTFKPYNPGKALGDTSPTLPSAPPPPPPPSRGGCGGIGMILTIAVVIAATVFTAGAAAAAMGAVSSTMGTMAAGMAALSGGLGMAGVAAAAVGAAVGSIVGQGFAMAIGQQDSFSWKQVGLSALGGAVSAGVGSVLQGSSTMTQIFGKAAETSRIIGQAAVVNTFTQGLMTASGLQHSFDWRGVAASAASAGAGKYVQGMGFSSFGQGMARGMAGYAVTGGSFQRALPGIVGNAFGDHLVNDAYEAQQKTTMEQQLEQAQRDRQQPNPHLGNGVSIIPEQAQAFGPRFASEQEQVITTLPYGERPLAQTNRDVEMLRLMAQAQAPQHQQVVPLNLGEIRGVGDHTNVNNISLPLSKTGRQGFVEGLRGEGSVMEMESTSKMLGRYVGMAGEVVNQMFNPKEIAHGMWMAIDSGNPLQMGIATMGFFPIGSIGRAPVAIAKGLIGARRLEVEIARIGKEGHALARHGAGVNDSQLFIRATTGVGPDGAIAFGKNGIPYIPPSSTAFHSNDLLVHSDLFIRKNYLNQAISASNGSAKITITGIDMERSVGRGFDRVTSAPGAFGPLQFNSDLTRVSAVYQRDAVTGLWNTTTIYPVK